MNGRWLIPTTLLLMQSMAASAQPPAPYEHRYYEGGYQVFVGSGNLPRARQVVENALYWRPDDPLWIERMALVTGWQGDTEASLAAWLRLAEEGHDAEAWRHVLTLAPQTFDFELLLKARRRMLRADPGNPDLVGKVVREYELLGRPEEGFAFLRQWYSSHPGRAVLKELQRIAEHIGHDDAAASYYRRYMDRYGVESEMATRLADLLWLQGKRETAYRGLRADAGALPYEAGVTRRLAVMAMELGDWETALHSYRRLDDNGDASVADYYQYIALARFHAPRRVAAILERLWNRTGRPDMAVGMLAALAARGERQAIDDFFNNLDSTNFERLAANPAFLRFLADYRQGRGDLEGARAALSRALILDPDDTQTRVAWLWINVSDGTDEALAGLLERWEPSARQDERFWMPLAAAHMALDQPEQALRYELAMLGRAPRQWTRRWSYAQALIASGREDQAWPVMRELWRSPPVSEDMTSAETLLFEEMRSALAARFASADEQLRFQQRAWADTPPEMKAARAEWLAQWALSVDAPELARLWYLREGRLLGRPLPPGSAMALAYLDSDHGAIRTLRDDAADPLTAGERLEADNTLGRERWAAAQLARQQYHAPEVADRHPQQESLLLPASHKVASSVERRHLGPLDVDLFQVGQRWPVAERWHLDWEGSRRRFSSNDQQQLQVGEDEQRLTVAAAYQGRKRALSLRFGHRSLFGYNRQDLEFSVSGEPFRDIDWRIEAQWRAPTDETSELLLMGQRSGVALETNWRPMAHWWNGVSLAHYDYQDLRDRDLGEGTLVSAYTSWRPWLSRWSPGVRLRHSQAGFSGQRPVDPGIDVIHATGNPLAVPQSYHETELAFLLGMPDVHIRPHRIQAWGEFGVTDNSLSGTGFVARVGAEGPWLGRDAWRLYFERGLNTGGGQEDSYRLGLEYQFYY
ncbi:tetratricopeptide repeat protein [Alloalcanivorax xenomutans]|uniref:tetratricopeptide repeat protein n=1 Tax=Alloalcanivorax xenomutans TaxID=1094342 RepID=UPI000BDA5231|nr:tetratricopeptide repeat protein [Alloalcanivorax xenomutans]SOC04153.1 tetratricopeptide repeat protein [Alloalcanivorax xenomutans]